MLADSRIRATGDGRSSKHLYIYVLHEYWFYTASTHVHFVLPIP